MRKLFILPVALALCAFQRPSPEHRPTIAVEPPAAPANGAIFQASNGYTPLTNGQRAGMVGDVLTVVLVERTQGQSTSTSNTEREGNIALTPPATGPLSFFAGTDVSMGGQNAFQGRGVTGQSNSLLGEITVTVAEVYPNGAMRITGEKQLRINRGNEHIRLTGIIRPADISPDNRVASTRIADARIDYIGRGEIARASRQGWLQRFFNLLSPF
ncbi:flagellar basal body L-ring protein FlgH [Sphingosinicella sp.]|uniref:flagellar basal body L-ring protein FlgH n=1 Tax=Sphingosinicella sp. TaxID=1917971 RepID=UPI0040376CEF